MSRSVTPVPSCRSLSIGTGYPVQRYPSFQSDLPKLEAEIKTGSVSFSEFCRQLFNGSTVNGVQHVAAAATSFRRIVWSVISIVCLVGFVYQSVQFLLLYLAKPTVVEVNVVIEPNRPFPAITVCNKNRIRWSALCEMYPKKCEAIRENREKGFINITELATLTYWSYSLNISERASLGHQEWPLITLCRGQYMDNCSDPVFFYQYLFSNCYTIEQPLKLDNWKNVWITQVVTMILNFETEDFMEVLRQPGGFLFIHPLDSLPDFRRDYVEVNPGSKVDIKLQKRSTILRDSPITKCTDYTSVLSHWYPNKKMNPRQCSQECLAEAVEQQCDCAHFTSIYPNVRRCNEVNATEYGCIFEAEKIHVDNCLDSCAPPCEKEYYEQQMSYFQWPTRLEELRRLLPNDMKNMTLEFAQKQLAEVTVSFPSNEHVIHKHQPKFEAVEVFSYVGGYIGIWLGVSLVTLWEFLERLILLLQFILQNLCCKLAGCSQVKPKHKGTVIQMTTH